MLIWNNDFTHSLCHFVFKVSLSGKRLLLIRVRNPWGTEKGEWTGDWSDHSDLWDKVSENTRNQLKVMSRLRNSCRDSMEYNINVCHQNHII